ncbi:MAG: hypothetical protein ACFFAQ_10030 [Promethearchaeota archaeon]
MNEYIRDRVKQNIPNTLLYIQEEAIDEIEAQYLGLGIPEILPKIREKTTQDIKDEIIEVQFIPFTLEYLKNLSMPLFVERLFASMPASIISESLEIVSTNNATRIEALWAAQLINDTLDQVITSNSTTQAVARDLFFNNYEFQENYSTSIEGVSEFNTGSSYSLNFTATAQQRLLDGFGGAPGLLQDLENGTGVLGYMEFYVNATIDPATYNATMQTTYNSTWDQLTALANYISNHLIGYSVPYYFAQDYGMTPSQYATVRARDLFFNDVNWSSTTKNITIINGISEYFSEYLSGYSLNYTLEAQYRLLYGYGESPGILENILLGTGLKDYLAFYADTLGNATMQTQYNATQNQLSILTIYLGAYLVDIIMPIQLALEGLTLETAALRDFYIQWANGSIFTAGINLNDLSDEMGEMLKASRAAIRIQNTIEYVIEINSTSEIIARDKFFNNYTFQDNYSTSTIMGVSEYFTGGSYSLNFTLAAQYRLLEGYQDYPGIFLYNETGFGLLNWLDFYESARLDIGTNRTLMVNTYNATWDTQLSPFGEYLRNYILGTVITSAVQRGLEVGIPYTSHILFNDTVNLWDPMNSNALVNNTGISKWYGAYLGHQIGNHTIQNELNTTFDLTQTQFNQLYTWLIQKIKEVLMPIAFIVEAPLGYRLLTIEYAEILFLEQWANGTVVPTGLDLGNGVKGFEVGLPNKTYISYDTVLALFDTENSSSFIDNYGILKWINAINDTIEKNQLMALFNLNTTQMDMILNWLFPSFRYDVIPNIIGLYDFSVNFYPNVKTYLGILQVKKIGYTMNDFARLEFNRQWTNGSLFLDGIDLDPAFGVVNLTGWELGIPIESNINLETSIDLWSEENPFSLTHFKGIAIWLKAANHEGAYNKLKHYYNQTIFVLDQVSNIVNIVNYNLDDTKMDAIITWLLVVKEKYSHPYLIEKLNLPTDIYTYGEAWFLGFTITSAIFLTLGCASLILVLSTKKTKIR